MSEPVYHRREHRRKAAGIVTVGGMGTGKTITGARTAAVLAAAAVALAAAGCSSGDDAASPPETAPTGTAQQGTAQQGTAQADAGQASPAPATPPPGGAAAVHALTLNGQPLGTGFPDVRCEHERDEGHPQIELEAQDRAAGTELQVEIVLSDPPQLDDFQWEQGGDEWEATDADRAAATITVDGTRYSVAGPVTHDDTGEAGRLEAEFTCP